MDTERAELHLRRLAEAELRRAADGHGKPPYGLATLSKAVPGGARIAQVANALVAVGAVAAETAEQVQADLDLALAVRRPGGQSTPDLLRLPGVRRLVMRTQPYSFAPLTPAGLGTAAGPGTAAQPGSASGPQSHRVAPVGMMIPVSADDCRGELYLLAYQQTASAALFTVIGWVRDTGAMVGIPIARVIEQLSVTDAKGTAYLLDFTGGSGVSEFSGDLRLHPAPAADVDWLDVRAGDATRRVRLTSPAPAAQVMPVSRTPGEQYLHAIAAHILSAVPPFPNDGYHVRTHLPGLPAHLAAGLGDIIIGLQAAAVLSPLSPVPGQLATLCEGLGLTGHGIAAPPSAALPDPWFSMLSQYLRRRRHPVPKAEGGAGTAITFPPVDDVTLSVLGLHNGEDGTVLHVAAAGLGDHYARGGLSSETLHHVLPLWLRDDDGRWHTPRRAISVFRYGEELMARLEIVPPLPLTAAVEVVVSGATAEASAILPLRWR